MKHLLIYESGNLHIMQELFHVGDIFVFSEDLDNGDTRLIARNLGGLKCFSS